jgi:integrase
MASIYRPAGSLTYRFAFLDQNRRRRTAGGYRDRKATESLARKVEQDAQRMHAGLEPLWPELTLPILTGSKRQVLTWQQFRERYAAEVLGGQRLKSQTKARVVFDAFEQECRPHRLADVNEELLSKFAAALRVREIKKRGKVIRIGCAPWTVKNYLRCLKDALAWAARQKLITAVPAFPDVKVPRILPRPIAPADWQALHAAAPSAEWRAFLLCGWYGGLRLAEAFELRRVASDSYPWLDLTADRIWLPARFVKADTDQWIPLHPELRRALAELPAAGDRLFDFRNSRTGEPLTANGAGSNVITWAKKAGVKLSMHRLRKGFGCRVAQQLGKGDAPVLHRLMRHSSMQVTMDFYASVDDVLHAKISELDSAPGPAAEELRGRQAPERGQDPPQQGPQRTAEVPEQAPDTGRPEENR